MITKSLMKIRPNREAHEHTQTQKQAEGDDKQMSKDHGLWTLVFRCVYP